MKFYLHFTLSRVDVTIWSSLFHESSEFKCVKNVQMRSFFCSVFPCIWTKYGDLRSKSPYSVRIHENTDQKKLRFWTLFTQ